MSEMVPSGKDSDGAALLLASARERLAVALADLALPGPHRLTEWQRASVSALLGGLIQGIEEELRSELAVFFSTPGAEAVHAAITSAHLPIAGPILERSFALADTALLNVLLRRAEEHRLHKSASAEGGLLVELAGDGDESVAAEAMAMLIALGGRLDRFQEPVLARTELGAEFQHRVIWAVAAALRRYLTVEQRVPPQAADRAIAACANRILAAYDEGRTIDSVALRLSRRLYQESRLDDVLILRSLGEGGLPFFIAALSVRTSLAQEAVWELLSEPSGRGAALLLSAAEVARSEAGAILLRLGGDRIEVQIDIYDSLDRGEAGTMLGLWQADPGYRAAIARLNS
jgi:uncharacterized protein (DUF2336 family)